MRFSRIIPENRSLKTQKYDALHRAPIRALGRGMAYNALRSVLVSRMVGPLPCFHPFPTVTAAMCRISTL